MRSQFEELVPDDFKQYREIAVRFRNVDMTNIDELHQLTVDSWLLATRWSEIQSNSTIFKEQNVNKTDFQNWAYQKYRQLQELHITCRSWYRLAVEEYRTNLMIKE